MAKKKSPRDKSQRSASVTTPDLARAAQLVMQLMAIPGKSGEEGAVAEFVRDRLLKAGAPATSIKHDSAHRRSPLKGQVGNLLLRLPGSTGGPRRLLTAHLDTVPICVGCRPTRRGNLVNSAVAGTGLGADNRAGTAAILSAAMEILERQLPHPPLTFCWFVQEEIGLQGARNLSKSLLGKPRLAFNWDGGSPYKLTVGATGGYRLLIEVEGIASHAGGAPECGVSAIAVAAIAIADLQRDGWHGAIRKGNRLGSSNVGFIHGGEATNVVTDRVVLKAEARSHDPKFRMKIVKRIEQSFTRAAREVKNVAGARGKVAFDGRLDYDSFLLPPDEPCLLEAERQVRRLGKEPQRAVANGGLDANWLWRHGIPAVSLGCGQLNQHMVTEALDIEQFHDACRLTLQLATGQA